MTLSIVFLILNIFLLNENLTLKIDSAASTGSRGTYSDSFPWPLVKTVLSILKYFVLLEHMMATGGLKLIKKSTKY